MVELQGCCFATCPTKVTVVSVAFQHRFLNVPQVMSLTTGVRAPRAMCTRNIFPTSSAPLSPIVPHLNTRVSVLTHSLPVRQFSAVLRPLWGTEPVLVLQLSGGFIYPLTGELADLQKTLFNIAYFTMLFASYSSSPRPRRAKTLSVPQFAKISAGDRWFCCAPGWAES